MQLISIQAKDLFHALADLTRLRVVRLLANANNEACLCELVDSLTESQYKLSRHLKILRQVGLLKTKKEGRWVYHRLCSGNRHLDHLYQFIKIIPDSDNTFSNDMSRFKNRLLLRENGRCNIGIQNYKETKY